MIECKGRNGYFKFHSFEVYMPNDDFCLIEIYSKKKGSKISAPIIITGTKDEVICLVQNLHMNLTKMLRETMKTGRSALSGEVKIADFE